MGIQTHAWQPSQGRDFYSSTAFNALINAIPNIHDYPIVTRLRQTEIPEHLQYLMLADKNMFTAGAVVVITTANRVLFQIRRNGYQMFGGGGYEMTAFEAFMLAKGEGFCEANIDSGDLSVVLQLSRPIWIQSTAQPGLCWVQAVLAPEEMLYQCSHEGPIFLGDRCIWSRETAHNYFHAPDAYSDRPSANTVLLSQTPSNRFMFRIDDIYEIGKQNFSDWRHHDALAMRTISNLMKKDLLWQYTPQETMVHIELKEPWDHARISPDWYVKVHELAALLDTNAVGPMGEALLMQPLPLLKEPGLCSLRRSLYHGQFGMGKHGF
jgi:hypothetical protein